MRASNTLVLWLTLCLSAITPLLGGEPIPQWAVNEPSTPPVANYVYISGMGIGGNEAEAAERAWDDAIRKSLSQGGLLEYSTEGVEILRNRIARKSKCQTPGILTADGRVKVYVLFQIPKRASELVDDAGEVFDCHDEAFKRDLAVWNYGEYPAREVVPRAFVPGMAQFYKGSTGKGAAFIIGEVAFVGGIVGAECVRQAAINRINATHDATLRTTYTRRANNAALVRNVSIAGAVAVYAWNVIDGIVARGKRHVFVGDNWQMDFAPYADGQSGGLAVHIAF